MLFEYQISIAIVLYLDKNGQCRTLVPDIITLATADVLAIKILKYVHRKWLVIPP